MNNSEEASKTIRSTSTSFNEKTQQATVFVIVIISGQESSAVADMLPNRLYERIHQRPPCNCENNVSPTSDALTDGDSLEISGSYLVQEN